MKAKEITNMTFARISFHLSKTFTLTRMLFMLQINNEGDENQDSGSCHVENQSINHEIHN